MGSITHQIVSLSLAAVLSGAPGVAVACAALCGIGVMPHAADHARHQPSRVASAVAPVAAPEDAEGPTHHHQHEAPAAAAHANHDASHVSPAPHHASHATHRSGHSADAHRTASGHDGAVSGQAPTPRVSREPVTCCGAHETHDMRPARTPTRIDLSTASLTLTVHPVVVPANLVTWLSEPRAGLPPPPTPTRAPLILRI